MADACVYSIIEQMIGIIVGYIPILPAFYRHIAERCRTPSSRPLSSKMFINSFMTRKRAQKSSPQSVMYTNKPFNAKEYEEIDDTEAQAIQKFQPSNRLRDPPSIPVSLGSPFIIEFSFDKISYSSENTNNSAV